MVARKPSNEPKALQAALVASLDRRIRSEGELSFPAAPSLLELYLARLASMFASLGKRFSRAELATLRSLLEPRLKDGFERSPHARVHLKWQPEDPPGTGIDYRIWLSVSGFEDEYDAWAESSDPGLFGANPDAKLLEVARALGEPRRQRVLDIGAGTGRNAFALARAGFAVDALETTPAFCEALRRTAQSERLPLEVIQANVFAPELALGRARYSLVVCSEVTSHFRGSRDLRSLFERAATWTRREGSLLVSIFISEPDREPTPLARELSQIAWSTLFTRKELTLAKRGLPFSLLSDESVHAYEKAHQPPEGWPPTSWFESWSRGHNLYRVKKGAAPVELRWLHYRKVAPKKPPVRRR